MRRRRQRQAGARLAGLLAGCLAAHALLCSVAGGVCARHAPLWRECAASRSAVGTHSQGSGLGSAPHPVFLH